MGYQALLFCPDEKLARVVGQVFGEIEFGAETVNEPFVAVEKMMSQRYDAIVVDCTDEQNASLLLKSARNSSFNQGSLAIALAEGQAGVAKAYRIGANLVLTKPINVEQAKGTLRVARGLLRKNFDAATATSHAASDVASHSAPTEPATPEPTTATPTLAVWPVLPARGTAKPLTSTASYAETPAIEAPHSAIAAPVQPGEKPAFVPALGGETSAAIVAQAPADSAPPATKLVSQEPARTDAAQLLDAKTPAAPTPVATTAFTSSSAAAAPARASEHIAPAGREITEVKNKEIESKEVEKKIGADTPEKEKAPVIASAVPSQAGTSIRLPSLPYSTALEAVGVKNAGASGHNQRLLIVAAAVLAIAATGYFGWTKFGAATSNRVERQATPLQQPGNVLEVGRMPVGTSFPPAGIINRATGATATAAGKVFATKFAQSSADASPMTRLAYTPRPEEQKAASVPIQVKSAAGGETGQAQTEETISQPPNPLAVATAGDNGLSGLVASPASSVQPVLARIRVSQGVSQGLLIKRVQPKYPANALAVRAQGAVEIEATIDKEGKVVNPRVLSGDRTLTSAALEAVRQWRYKPYYLDGEPVEIQTQITINFKLN